MTTHYDTSVLHQVAQVYAKHTLTPGLPLEVQAEAAFFTGLCIALDIAHYDPEYAEALRSTTTPFPKAEAGVADMRRRFPIPPKPAVGTESADDEQQCRFDDTCDRVASVNSDDGPMCPHHYAAYTRNELRAEIEKIMDPNR